jgi:hypothetical protein
MIEIFLALTILSGVPICKGHWERHEAANSGAREQVLRAAGIEFCGIMRDLVFVVEQEHQNIRARTTQILTAYFESNIRVARSVIIDDCRAAWKDDISKNQMPLCISLLDECINSSKRPAIRNGYLYRCCYPKCGPTSVIGNHYLWEKLGHKHPIASCSITQSKALYFKL